MTFMLFSCLQLKKQKEFISVTKSLQIDSNLSFPHGWKLDFPSPPFSLEFDLFTSQAVPMEITLNFIIQLLA